MDFKLHDEAILTGLTLKVKDLEMMVSFYCDILGLQAVERNDDIILLAGNDKNLFIKLVGYPSATLRPYPSIGLYHFALLLPHRETLSGLLRRLIAAKVHFEGASDHGVSEALYIRDPEGNGIEFYCDRPRDQWQYRNGEIAMFTDPLDVDGLLAESEEEAGLPADTRLGHMHLHVDDLDVAEEFYTKVIGLEVMQRSYPGARFLATGGYHHHLGVNIWARGRKAPDNSTGLLSYEWRVPDGSIDEIERHMLKIGVPFKKKNSKLWVKDPSGVKVGIY